MSKVKTLELISKEIGQDLKDSRYIDKTDSTIKTCKIKSNFREIKVTPNYAKYFSTGQKK